MVMKKKKDDGMKYYQMITENGLIDLPNEEQSNDNQKPSKVKEWWQYFGAVYMWDKCIIPKFEARTFAVSEAKARQNIIFQAKKKMGYEPSAGGFTLKGTLRKTQED